MAALANRTTWFKICCYGLFIFSTFSITGAEALIMVLYGLALYHRWREPAQEALPTWLILPFIMFLVATVISALVNPTPLANLWGARELFHLALPLTLPLALELVDRRRLLLVYAVPLSLMALYGVIQYYWGVDWLRPEGKKIVEPLQAYMTGGTQVFYGKGNFSHHQTFAGFMLINVALFASLFFMQRGFWRLPWGLASVLAAGGVAFSLTRSAWLGVGVGLLMVVLRFPRRWVLPVVGLGAMSILLGTMWTTNFLYKNISYRDKPTFVKRLITINASHDRPRLYMWEAAWLGFKDNPVFGVGLNNDTRTYGQYRQIVSRRHGDFKFSMPPGAGAHNIYLQVAFELGLVGLAAYLSMFGAIFVWNGLWLKRAGRNFAWERALLYGASAGLVGSMAAGIFESNFYDSEVRILILLLMGLSVHTGMVIRRGLAWTGAQP